MAVLLQVAQKQQTSAAAVRSRTPAGAAAALVVVLQVAQKQQTSAAVVRPRTPAGAAAAASARVRTQAAQARRGYTKMQLVRSRTQVAPAR